MKAYGNRGYTGNPEYEPYGMPANDDDEFDMNDEWHEEEFDENVSHASSRAANTIVDSQRSNRLKNQLGQNSQNYREVAPRASSPGIKRATNFREPTDVINEEEDGQGVYEEGDYLVVGQEVIVEEQHDKDPEQERDFKNAYDQLVEKMFIEQGNDLLISQEEYAKAMQKKELRRNLKERTDERVKEFQENKRRKMEMIKHENEKKEMEHCTFKPQMMTRSVPHTTSAAPRTSRKVMFSASRIRSHPMGMAIRGCAEMIAVTRTA